MARALYIADRSARADIVLANPMTGVSDPRGGEHPHHTSFVRCRYPTRELVLDVFMTKSLAAAGVPSASVTWAGKWLTDGLSVPWHDRLPGSLPVTVMQGSSVDNPCRYCPGYVEMLSDVCSETSWDMRELVCHRLYMRYPLWGAAHLLVFDFGR